MSTEHPSFLTPLQAMMTTQTAFELNTTKALKPAAAEYNKVDLEEAHQQRRQSKVTLMLEAERRLIRGMAMRVERTSSFN
jgi:hypothetical protein